ncbi:MAG TPA: flagellar basal body rod C-terminal domain-containing protein, partial [Lacipirellulaceae bacterium]|nr:flagellar basal body rod C-terminal domain-containing protein [Lacipirellulaceae bacterium]
QLAEIADVTVSESPSGALNVSTYGETLVFEGTRREVAVAYGTSNGLPTATVTMAAGGNPLRVHSGQLHGVYEARDKIAGGFLQQLNQFAGTLAFEFNKIYSQGQGINGFTQAVSQNGVSDAGAALDAAGLAFTPVNGSFHVLIRNKQTGLVQTHAVRVDLDGFDQDTSLGSLAAELDGIDGLTARITSDGRLELRSTSAELQFGFDGDTSGLLAALGLNTFFTGSHAGDLGVNAELLVDGSKFAASGDNETYFGVDIANARRLVSFYDEGVDSLGGTSVVGLYDQLVNQVAQGSAAASALADGFRVFEGSLAATAQAVSGVNLDEEAIDMLLLQQAYQASARYIATLSELLDILVNL